MNKFRGLLWLVAALSIPASGLAAKPDDSTMIVSPRVYSQLKKAEELLAKSAYGQALTLLNKLLPETDQGTYEEAAVLRTLASIHAQQEKYAQAADALQKSLATGALPSAQEQEARLNLGKLYLAAKEIRKAITVLEAWLQHAPSVDADTHILLANAYAQQKQYRKAIPHVEKAIALSDKKSEEWYKLLLALNYESGNYRACVSVLQTLIQRNPHNRDYWQQLTGMYQQLNQHAKATAVKQLADLQGFLKTEKEVMELVHLYLYVKAPFRAARLMEQEIREGRIQSNGKNWEFLADAWTAAREYDRAIAALKKASDMNDNGEIYLRLGRLHVEQEQWGDAQSALNRAISKGGLKRPGDAYLLLGMSYHELKRKPEAQQAFAKAQNYPASRQSARQWLHYLTSEPS